MKILTIIGARPQFIKAATFSRYLQNHKSKFNEIILHTGQHFDTNMSKIFFDELEIPNPKYNLNISALSHGSMTGRMIEQIEIIAKNENPDLFLVYGDTNSTLAGAIVSSKLSIPLVHIESGLRSFNNSMPEEINRVLTDRISNYLFCPTSTSVDNLINEGFNNFKDKQIILCGDIMYESSLYYSNKSLMPSFFTKNNISKFILATIHRAESTNDVIILSNIIRAFNEINKIIPIVMPLHPRTLDIIKTNNIRIDFFIIDPVGYLEMLWLLQNSFLVITDSGGVQKEAYFFQKFCLTIRNETEWIELVTSGNNILVGTETNNILNAFNNNVSFKQSNSNIFGNGNTSEIILNTLEKNFL